MKRTLYRKKSDGWVLACVHSSATDSQAFAAYDGETDRVIVAFRGTDPLNIKNVRRPSFCPPVLVA